MSKPHRRPKSQLAAYDSTKERRLTQKEKVLAVIRQAGRAITLSEITERYNERFNSRTPESTISGRLNELEAAGVLQNYRQRQCAVAFRVKQTWFFAPAVDVQLSLGMAS